jgi:hypothetical protein
MLLGGVVVNTGFSVMDLGAIEFYSGTGSFTVLGGQSTHINSTEVGITMPI